MKATAFVFARGGSKGLPGKNIRPLAGKPLIAWSIEHALAVGRIERVIVSTDSARDDSPEWLAWKHALEYLHSTEGAMPEVMVSVPATAPMRSPQDIENCLDEYEKGGADVVITVTDAHRSPYFNMVKGNEDGTVGLVIPPESTVTRRQDAPVVYDMATVAYVARSEFVMSHYGTFEGRVRKVHVPVQRAIDIDTLLDFQMAECLLHTAVKES